MEKAIFLKESEFDLTKVKFDGDEMIAEFIAVRQENEGVSRTPMTIKPTLAIHPDLKDLFDRLKIYVLKQYGYDVLYNAIPKGGKVTKETKDAWKELISNTTVSGFSISGSDQLIGAVITAKLKTNSGTRAMPTGRIVFSSDKLGYEKEVEVLVEEATSEVYQCLFQNKRAQLDLFEEGKKEETKLGLVS